MRSAVVIAVLLFVASANGMAFSKLKAQRQAARQQQQLTSMSMSTATATATFGLNTVQTRYPGCEEIGEVKCRLLVDGIADANHKVTAMTAHLTAHGADAHFTAAFGAANPAHVAACLAHLANPANQLLLWNAEANKDGTVYKAGDTAWAGLAVIPGTNRLLVGSVAYGRTPSQMGGVLIHEASHAFCQTIDDHAGRNGYESSPDFHTVKGANNADSYRVYAHRVSP